MAVELPTSLPKFYHFPAAYSDGQGELRAAAQGERLTRRVRAPTSGVWSVTFPPMMGEELRKARQQAGIAQEQLSFRAGLSRRH